MVNTDEKQGGCPSPSDASTDDADKRGYLKGWRLFVATVLIILIAFIVQVDTSIVTTSLVKISADIGAFETVSWILSGYLLGFVSLAVVMSKLGDLLGRKPIFAVCVFLFTAFSGGCAAAKTMPQLITLRAFQGVGGGASLATATVVLVQMVPPKDYAKFVAYTSVSGILALVLGPLIGGAISDSASWRWIFLFSVPIGALCLVLVFLSLPNRFPDHMKPVKAAPTSHMLHSIDYLGCALLICASVTFTAAFEETGSRFSWKSGYFIGLIVVSALCWAVFLLWERRLTLADKTRQPVLPWRFFKSLEMVCIMVGIVLVSGGITVTIFQLPQRFQLVNGLHSVGAGLRLMPFGAALTLGSFIVSALSKKKVPLVYIILAGSLLQVVGYALLSTTRGYDGIPAKIYGFQIIAGVGAGMGYIGLFLMIPLLAEERDHAVGMGMGTQFRAMGSALVLSIASAVFNAHVIPRIKQLGVVDPNSLITLSRADTQHIPAELRRSIAEVLLDGYKRQMIATCVTAAVQVPAVLLMWKRKQVTAP